MACPWCTPTSGSPLWLQSVRGRRAGDARARPRRGRQLGLGGGGGGGGVTALGEGRGGRISAIEGEPECGGQHLPKARRRRRPIAPPPRDRGGARRGRVGRRRGGRRREGGGGREARPVQIPHTTIKRRGAGGPPGAWTVVSELIPFDNIEDEGNDNTVPSVCLSNDLH